MKPWEFIIESPEDLLIFADLLEEWGHPGAEVVRWMIKEKKFPGEARKGEWWWVGKHDTERNSWEINKEIFCCYYHNYYYSIEEAVWALINAQIYKLRSTSRR